MQGLFPIVPSVSYTYNFWKGILQQFKFSCYIILLVMAYILHL
jgi:hypothetical protein